MVTQAAKQKIRSYFPENKQKGRHRSDEAEEQYEVHENRRRVQGSHGKSWLHRGTVFVSSATYAKASYPFAPLALQKVSYLHQRLVASIRNLNTP